MTFERIIIILLGGAMLLHALAWVLRTWFAV